MMTEDADRSAEMPGTTPQGSGRNPREHGACASTITARKESSYSETSGLMDAVVERENMRQAYSRVMRNKGAAGVDEMPVADLKAHLQMHWLQIKEDLLAGRYEPAAVRSVSIPKPGGKGERLLGIPTVTDRLIQQALHQVLSPIFDVDFSESSYGFRPGRHARQAVQQARRYVGEGRRLGG